MKGKADKSRKKQKEEDEKNKVLLQKQLQNLSNKADNIQKMMEKGKDTIILRINYPFTEFGLADASCPMLIPSSLTNSKNILIKDRDNETKEGWAYLQKSLIEATKAQNGLNSNGNEQHTNTYIVNPDSRNGNDLQSKTQNTHKILKEIFMKMETNRAELVASGFLFDKEDIISEQQDVLPPDQFSNFHQISNVMKSLQYLEPDVSGNLDLEQVKQGDLHEVSKEQSQSLIEEVEYKVLYLYLCLYSYLYFVYKI